jgi:bifunctional DNase/RNase
MKNVVQVAVKGLAIDERSKSPVVILQEVGGTRAVPIWIGPAEASAIAMEVAGKKFQRPLTHDLMVTIIEGLKAKVTRVVISDLRENTYYAHIFIERRKEVVSIDARPSDSIAIALRTKSPIFISDKLLDGQVGEESSAGEGSMEERPREKTEAERAEDLRRRLEQMDPEDFGRFQL